jgi:hypothetical protein
VSSRAQRRTCVLCLQHSRPCPRAVAVRFQFCHELPGCQTRSSKRRGSSQLLIPAVWNHPILCSFFGTNLPARRRSRKNELLFPTLYVLAGARVATFPSRTPGTGSSFFARPPIKQRGPDLLVVIAKNLDNRHTRDPCACLAIDLESSDQPPKILSPGALGRI